MNETIWFIEIAGKQEGPYSILDLKRDSRINPETLVWKEGFEKWVPIGEVPELRIIFKDDEEAESEEFDIPADEEAALDMQREPPPYIRYIILVAIGVLLYFLFQIIWGE